MTTHITTQVAAQLAAHGINAHAGRPTATPPGPYVFVGSRTPLRGTPLLNRSASNTVTVTVSAVGRTIGICEDTLRAALAVIDDWRPLPEDPSVSPLRRIDGSEAIPDGPAGDIRWTQTAILRCSVPRGQHTDPEGAPNGTD